MISKQPCPVGRNAHPNLPGSRAIGLKAARLVHGMLRAARLLALRERRRYDPAIDPLEPFRQAGSLRHSWQFTP